MSAASDDEVGSAREKTGQRQTAQQKALLGQGGEAGGKREPSPAEAPGDRDPPIKGGSSAGQGDRKPSR